MGTQKSERGSFARHCMVLWDSYTVWYSCKHGVAIIEGDLQDTVKAPFREFCD